MDLSDTNSSNYLNIPLVMPPMVPSMLIPPSGAYNPPSSMGLPMVSLMAIPMTLPGSMGTVLTTGMMMLPPGMSSGVAGGSGGVRTLYCTVEGCTYSAASSALLKKHMRSHSGMHQYACNVEGCGFSSPQSGKLKIHSRTHSGVRPYNCDFPGCGYSASKSSHLKNHLRTHSGERPYICSFEGCTYTAAERCNLKRHLKTHDN